MELVLWQQFLIVAVLGMIAPRVLVFIWKLAFITIDEIHHKLMFKYMKESSFIYQLRKSIEESRCDFGQYNKYSMYSPKQYGGVIEVRTVVKELFEEVEKLKKLRECELAEKTMAKNAGQGTPNP
jgi:hypothetical protein